MAKTMSFFLGDKSIRKTMGSGKHRTMMSSAMLLYTCASPRARMSHRILPPCHVSEIGSTRVITIFPDLSIPEVGDNHPHNLIGPRGHSLR